MKLTYSKKYMRINKGCYTLDKINKLSFMNKKDNSKITIIDILKSNIKFSDKIWWLYYISDLTYDNWKHINNIFKIKKIINDKYPDWVFTGCSDLDDISYSGFYKLSYIEKRIIKDELIKYFKQQMKIK